MVLGNKCDINDKRQVSKDRGEKVRHSKLNFRLNRFHTFYTQGVVQHIGINPKGVGIVLMSSIEFGKCVYFSIMSTIHVI